MSGRRSGTDAKTNSAERGHRRRRKSGRSFSPELQTPPRMASFSVGCRRRTERTEGQTGWSAMAAFADLRLQRRARSLSLPPSEHPVLASVGPNAHVASTSQYSHVRLAVEGRERNRSEVLSFSVGRVVLRCNDGCIGTTWGRWRQGKTRKLARSRCSRPRGRGKRLRRQVRRRIASADHLVPTRFSRFRIGRQQVEGKPHCRHATELSTGQPVFLKFYPSPGREFQNATRMHRALRSNGRVCKCVGNLGFLNGALITCAGCSRRCRARTATLRAWFSRLEPSRWSRDSEAGDRPRSSNAPSFTRYFS